MKVLPLDPTIIEKHQQLFEVSCVPMSIEFLVKLEDTTQVNFYEEQHKHPNGKIGGEYYDKKIIHSLSFSHLFSNSKNPRGTSFPLQQLIDKMKEEIDNGRYFQISLESGGNNYHMWIIYGYNDNLDFFGITKYWNNPHPHRISNVIEKLKKMGGTDIVVYQKI